MTSAQKSIPNAATIRIRKGTEKIISPEMKPQCRGRIHVEVGMMNVMKAPEDRDEMGARRATTNKR